MDYKKLNEGLKDIQNGDVGFIKKKIYKVGINNYKVPIKMFYPKVENHFNTIADVSAYASLPADKKGINMSRFSIVITECSKDSISSEAIEKILLKLQTEVECKNAYVKFKFDYLTEVFAPVTKFKSWFNIPVVMEGILEDGVIKKYITVEVNYTSLCPCSKEISKYGAHNQKSMARVKVELKNTTIHFEELKSLVDKASSCPIFNSLKRIDEKWVTEKAYENPAFTEDTSRGIAEQLDEWLDQKINDYIVVTENYESIHQSHAVGVITAGRKLK